MLADQYDIVIAGGGIAGLSAGLAAARRGRRTLVLTGDVLGGHLLSIETIEGYPGFPEGVPGYDLCPMAEEQTTEAGAEIAAGEITGLHAADGAWRVATTDGDRMAGTVILATGTRLRRLGVSGEERLTGKGVSQCASCDAPLLRGKPVVVVGGGDSAMQEALTLAEAASGVTMLVRGDALSGQATFRDRVSGHANIDMRFNTTVEEILGDDVVTGVRLHGPDGEAELEAAGVFVFVGLEPNTGFLQGMLDLAAMGHIPTDADLRTALPGVFAAGTVRAGSAGLATAAAGEGALAAVAADRYLADGVWRDG